MFYNFCIFCRFYGIKLGKTRILTIPIGKPSMHWRMVYQYGTVLLGSKNLSKWSKIKQLHAMTFRCFGQLASKGADRSISIGYCCRSNWFDLQLSTLCPRPIMICCHKKFFVSLSKLDEFNKFKIRKTQIVFFTCRCCVHQKQGSVPIDWLLRDLFVVLDDPNVLLQGPKGKPSRR